MYSAVFPAHKDALGASHNKSHHASTTVDEQESFLLSVEVCIVCFNYYF